MSPHVGFAEGHRVQRQAEVSTHDPGTGDFTCIAVMKHLMGWLQLMRMNILGVIVVVMIVAFCHGRFP